MRLILVIAALTLTSACSRQTTPPPTPESQSDHAAASAPNGVGSQRATEGRSETTGAKAQPTTPPSATATQQSQNAGQSATSRSSADQQGVTASPPDPR